MKSEIFHYLCCLLVTLVLGLKSASASDLRHYQDAPSFKLITQEGQTLSNADLKGSIWVASFFLTRCKGPCPMLMQRLRGLLDTFPEEESLKLLSITVDPEYDTVAKLKEYSQTYQAYLTRWSFLGGSATDTVELLNQGFKVGASADPQSHTLTLVLVDREGMVRGYYSGLRDEEVQRLGEEIKVLLAANNT